MLPMEQNFTHITIVLSRLLIISQNSYQHIKREYFIIISSEHIFEKFSNM